MPRSEDARTTRPDTAGSRSRSRSRSRGPGEPRPRRRAGAWLAVFLGVWAAVAGAALPNGLVLAAGLVMAALAVNRLGAEPRTARRAKPTAPP
ncbi:hypothetical protein ADK75_19560 [Streptomyces virginiae]|uniref:Uncharacterized protein n=1 Tax=Streptomyces virginiae TaxID=1961 RepID=A0A0L8MG90_STRVG|nr:hypothetical protein [Streptomyces virginiae]KOG49375.1 hypothetical protein ADK75_19560 [Streptomyces virginiae]